MKRLTIAAFVAALIGAASPGDARAEKPAPPPPSRPAGPTLDPVRPVWPIAREAAGGWGVIGEALARHAGHTAMAVRSVRFSILGEHGRVLHDETLDGPETLGQVLAVYRRDDSGQFTQQPAGTLVLDAGDVAVAYLAALVAPTARPARARVTMRFSEGSAKSFLVALDPYTPGQRLAWPLRLDDRAWLAANAAGTAHHWVGGALPTAHGLAISQRFALDLVRLDADGRTHPATATTKEEYYAWNEEVLSVGRGRVVAVSRDARDIEIGDTPSADVHPAGNFIVVQHGWRLFSVYAHLQQGSIAVSVGDWVERGQPLARVGNSGSTSEPHLHVHFADAWLPSGDGVTSFYFSQGVPALFWDAAVLRGDAAVPLRGATPLASDIVIGPREGDDRSK